jgi:hypothetical protein
MGHDWIVNHKPPPGSPLREPEGVECTKCGINAMRWVGTLYVTVYSAVRALLGKFDASSVPKVPTECTGVYVQWTPKDTR